MEAKEEGKVSELDQEFEDEMKIFGEKLGTGSRADAWIAHLYQTNFLRRLLGIIKEPRSRFLNKFAIAVHDAIEKRILLAWERLGMAYLRGELIGKYSSFIPYSLYLACAYTVLAKLDEFAMQSAYKLTAEDKALIKNEVINEASYICRADVRESLIYATPITVFTGVSMEGGNRLALLKLAAEIDMSHVRQDLFFNQNYGAKKGKENLNKKRKTGGRPTEEEADGEYKFMLLTDTIVDLLFRGLERLRRMSQEEVV